MACAVGLSHNMFDGNMFLGVCDKIVPGMVIGALSFGHIPAVFVPAGPMHSGISNKEKAKVRQQYAAGEVGEDKLLDYPFSTSEIGGKRERICFLCGETQGNKSHLPGAKDYHNFRAAKYILYFGEPRDIIRVKKNDALKKFSNHSNRYGEDIKVFIGTRSVSEGLDFKRIRQIHIIEPWYNLSRHEQVIGRGIRRDSHIDLPLEERNCEIFQYASIIPKSFDTKIYDRETIDLKNYRIAENKDIIIKKISRVMKESAVDCVLFRKTNIITDKTHVIDNIIKFVI